MNTLNTVSALAAIGLACSVAGAAAAQAPRTYGQTAPYGGVPSSCTNARSLPNGLISADCQGDSGYRTSTIRAADCRSALANRNGVLSCVGATATVGGVARPDIVETLLGTLFGAPSTAVR